MILLAPIENLFFRSSRSKISSPSRSQIFQQHMCPQIFTSISITRYGMISQSWKAKRKLQFVEEPHLPLQSIVATKLGAVFLTEGPQQRHGFVMHQEDPTQSHSYPHEKESKLRAQYIVTYDRWRAIRNKTCWGSWFINNGT